MVGNLDGQYRRDGPLTDRPLPRSLIGLHRSEIGPYLGSSSGYIPGSLRKLSLA